MTQCLGSVAPISMFESHLQIVSKFSCQMIFKLSLNRGHNLIFVGPQRCKKIDQKKKKLHSTDDRESSEKSHCATNKTELSFKLDLRVSFDLVKRCRVKVDLDKVETGGVLFFT